MRSIWKLVIGGVVVSLSTGCAGGDDVFAWLREADNVLASYAFILGWLDGISV